MSIVVDPDYPDDIEKIKERTNLSKKQYVEYSVKIFNSIELEERIKLIFDCLLKTSNQCNKGIGSD